MKQSSGFARVPAEVLQCGNGYAIAVYAAIAQHADRSGVAWPSLKRLSDITGWSRPTVDKAVKVLINLQAVEKQQRHANGAKLSNQYFLPFHAKSANVQMEASLPSTETSLPSMEASFTEVRKEVAKGTKPRFHEQEPREQDTKEQESFSLKDVSRKNPTEDRKPAVNGDTPAHHLVNAYYQIVGGTPTDHGKDIGHANTLLKAGVTSENFPTYISWLRGNWRAKTGFDLTTAVRAVNEWHSTQSAPTPVKRFIV